MSIFSIVCNLRYQKSSSRACHFYIKFDRDNSLPSYWNLFPEEPLLKFFPVGMYEPLNYRCYFLQIKVKRRQWWLMRTKKKTSATNKKYRLRLVRMLCWRRVCNTARLTSLPRSKSHSPQEKTKKKESGWCKHKTACATVCLRAMIAC